MNGIIVLKLSVLFIINLVALGYLIFSFMRLGHSYQLSLRMAWDLIILGITGNNDYSGVQLTIKWLNLMRKSWWMMLFLDCLVWVAVRNVYCMYFILFLLLFHGYWYLHATIRPVRMTEQILFANDNWGIIYREVDFNSGLDQKSLAELDLRKKNLLVLAIERDGKLLPFPKGLEVLKPGDRVLLFGALSSYRAMNQ